MTRVLWQNTRMPRWLFPLIAGVVGVAAGLVYGWVLNPVKFVDTTPASLRSDFRTDYVLMVAEAYHASPDVDRATRQLAIFGSDSPASLAAAALQSARQNGYAQADISLLQELTVALQAAQPVAPTGQATP